MTATRCSNRDVVDHAIHRPYRNAEGYGAMSYTFEGYLSGYLTDRLNRLFRDAQRRSGDKLRVIYSYGTPIAWFDKGYGVWVIPARSYSITTSKHQSYLWKLPNRVSIPADCGPEEYGRYVTGQMIHTGSGTRPGPNYTEGE